MDENVIEQRAEEYGKEIRPVEQYEKGPERLLESYCDLEEGDALFFFFGAKCSTASRLRGERSCHFAQM